MPADNKRSKDPETWAVSPSQIETFDDTRDGCNRKWALNYIGDEPKVSSSSAELGSRVHKILEEYLEHGTLPDQTTREGEIATSGIHLLPEPGLAIVEDTIGFIAPSGVRFTGRSDFTYLSPNIYTWEGGAFNPLVIGDHKTTGDFRWMKTADILRNDPQALIYAADSLLKTGDPAVELHWVYYRTRGAPQARETRVTLTVGDIQEKFPRLDDIAHKIKHTLATYTPETVMQVPANTDACEKYGGCPYRHICNISFGERERKRDPSMNQPFMPPPLPSLPSPPALPADTSALIAQLQAAANAPPPAPPQPSAVDALRARQAAMQAPPAVAVPSPVAPPPAAPALPILPPIAAPVIPEPIASWYGHPADPNVIVYGCVCGTHSLAQSLSVRPDGEKICPNCNRVAEGWRAAMFPPSAAPPVVHVPFQAPLPAAFVAPAVPINPPEATQAQPPPPAVPAPLAYVPPAPLQTGEAPPDPEKKRGGGRPAGSKNRPKDGSAGAGISGVGDDAEQSATWAKEMISPIPYNAVEIGPFTLTDFPRENETAAACLVRLIQEVNVIGETERARKIASYMAALPPRQI